MDRLRISRKEIERKWAPFLDPPPLCGRGRHSALMTQLFRDEPKIKCHAGSPRDLQAVAGCEEEIDLHRDLLGKKARPAAGARRAGTNDGALSVGARLLSAYRLRNGTKFWIITEADRSSTCILLPEDY